jgi:LemA protein
MSPMMMALIALGVVLVYVIGVYNALQTIKTRIVAAIQEIGNQLKRQSNLIPNLQESVKSYMKHEKGIFTMLTDARKSVDAAVKDGSMKSVQKASDMLQSVLPKIQVLVESNPELKADATVTQFMEELRDTADKLMYSRRTVIDLTQEYNQKLVTFPSNLVAMIFQFKPEKGLDVPMTGSHVSVSPDEMKDVKVSM